MRARAGRPAVAAAIAAVTLPLTLMACGSDDRPATTTEPRPESARRAIAQATDRDFDRRNFSDSTRIDNRWHPLVPGTQFVYEGESDRGQGRRPHQVIFTVTDLTKVINGVRTVVLWDRDIN